MLLIQKNEVFAEGEVGNRIKNLPPREARVSNNIPISTIKKALLPKNKGYLNLAAEVLKGFSPDVFNRLCVTHNKNLEQWKFRTKERVINLFLFKSNSENYGCQLRQLTGSIPFSIFLDTS